VSTNPGGFEKHTARNQCRVLSDTFYYPVTGDLFLQAVQLYEGEYSSFWKNTS